MRCLIKKCGLCVLSLLFLSPVIFAQLGKITVDLEKDKPKKFQTKTLKSEKTGQKKFTFPRRVMQNTVSHYNYYFNANNKLNDVIERARLANNDIYYKLLPFYSYSLANTASQANELDSVIYKATAGILLHDLRSAWVDNFYLLIGKAYVLKQAFDSASMAFQFINYNLYPKKKKNDDNQVVVGSNLNGGSSVSIANKEEGNILTKAFSLPPSRNDALVWQIRNLIELGEYADAAGLINTLRNDVNFPKRLTPFLEEVSAYWFYKQDIYDSAATHLEMALSNSIDIQERARSEYLLAQLYEITKNRNKASEYYNKAISHATDPLLDIYAHLSDAKMYDSSGENQIDKSIAILLRMARRDKFETYRDLIYYSAGELALEKPDTAAAEMFLKKSLTYSADISSKNRAFLKLADINFINKDYKEAFIYYDSLQVADSLIAENPRIIERRNALVEIVNTLNIIEREDSLQHIASMPVAERDAFIKSLAKKLRKQRGLKDEDISNTPSSVFETRNASSDIFSSNNAKGDWYFYNASAKARGFSEFRSKWGKRQNVDNWRRASASGKGIANKARDQNPTVNNQNVRDNISPDVNNPLGVDNTGDVDAVTTSDSITPQTLTNLDSVTDISYEGLLANVPTTDEKLKASHTILSNSLFQLGKLYQNRLEDYGIAIETYEKSLKLYPDSLYGGELYMNLSYCYQKLGNLAKANEYKNLLTSKFASSKFSKIMKNPKAAFEASKNTEATKKYESIYDLFIEGQFDSAIAQKRVADSLYGNNYWTPQLLYIESVYYIKQRQDSMAIEILTNIIESHPNSALKDKAATIIDVLKRRSDIEDYLTNLQIERAKENEPTVIRDEPVTPSIIVKNNDIKTQEVKKQDSIAMKPQSKDTVVSVVKKPDTIATELKKDKVVTPIKQDTVALNPVKEIKPPANNSFNFEPASPQLVAMLLNKVDPVYISEARNAFVRYNREKFPERPIEIVREVIDKDRSLLVFRQFQNATEALSYSDKIKKDAALEISWLPANKYSFFIISDANLQLLKTNKEVDNYLKVLQNSLPGKF
jgi:tetratricopeptide (TPR) repeat protein